MSIAKDETCSPSSCKKQGANSYPSSPQMDESRGIVPNVFLITGGAGFIGSYVADALLKREDKVVIVDEMNDYYDVRMKRSNLEDLTLKYGERVVVYEGDICEKGLVTNIFSKEKISNQFRIQRYKR